MAQDTSVRPKWDVRVSEYIVHGEPNAGTPITIVFRLPFGKAPGKGAFVLFDPPNRSAIRIDSVDSSLIPTGGGTWVFEEIDGGTRLTSRFNLRDDQQFRIPQWLFDLFARVDTIRSLRRLRRMVLKLHLREVHSLRKGSQRKTNTLDATHVN